MKPEASGRRPFRPGERVRAISAAFVAASDGEHTVHTGDIYSADHEVVQTVPDCFIPDDIPVTEIAAWLPELAVPEPVPSSFNIADPPEILPERQVIAIEGLGDLRRFVHKGQIVDVADPFVAAWPGHFSVYKPLTADDVERLSK
jgi:hypothetical protein